MFKKFKLKKKIKESKEKIEMLEQKRARSQAALVEAILTHTEPNDQDVDFFNLFTKKIDSERNVLTSYLKELETL